MTDTGFPGFPPAAQRFLADLAANNDRDWFNANKATYETAIKAPAQALLACLEPELAALAGGPVSGKIFRIHRDVRFAKDKRPYNTHLHIGFPAAPPKAAEGRSNDVVACGYFFGLETDKAVLGAGGFDFAGPVLDAYRAAAADPKKGAALRAILGKLAKAGLRIEGAELKRAPAPYPADHPRADLIRRKGLHVWRDIEDPAVIAGPMLFAEMKTTFTTLAPLVRWLSAL